MKYAKRGERKKTQQAFDKEKITVTKAGKTYNVYDAIQEANVDTDIYEVMKKYHCVEDEAVKLMEERGGTQGVYTDIVEIQEQCKDLGDLLMLQKRAQDLFDALPAEVKLKYGNDLQSFLKQEQEKAQEQKEKEKNQTTKSEVDNETK